MSLDPVSAGLDLVTSLVNRIWPDKSAVEKQRLIAAISADNNLTQLLVKQLDVDTAEAQNPNLWVSGARPFIMWVCGASFAWQFVVLPIISYLSSMIGHPVPIPSFDTSAMTSVLMGMLGLSGMRSWEKYQGVNNRHG